MRHGGMTGALRGSFGCTPIDPCAVIRPGWTLPCPVCGHDLAVCESPPALHLPEMHVPLGACMLGRDDVEPPHQAWATCAVDRISDLSGLRPSRIGHRLTRRPFATRLRGDLCHGAGSHHPLDLVARVGVFDGFSHSGSLSVTWQASAMRDFAAPAPLVGEPPRQGVAFCILSFRAHSRTHGTSTR